MMTMLAIVPRWCYGLLAAVALLIGVEFHGRHVVQAKWKAETVKRQAEEKAAIESRNESNRILAKAQSATNERISRDYKSAIDAADARLAAAKRGGLRYAGTCKPAGSTVADSTIRSDAAAAASVELPAAIAGRLFDLAADADKVVEQARACQAWVRDNGFAP